MSNPLDTLLPNSRRIADRYEVIRALGVGALGVSYLCTDQDLQRRVVVKVAYRHLLIGRRDRRLFDEWLRSVRQVESPRIAALQRSGSDPEVGTFFVSDFVVGRPLAGIITEAEAPFPAAEVLRILTGLQRALEDLGAQGPHGALHPNNILITEGEPVLTDVGSFRSVPSRLFVDAQKRQGTTGWLAPEVMRQRQDLDARTDIYSLCAIAAQMLTGEPPGPQQRKGLDQLHPALQSALRAGLTDTAEERVASLHAMEAALNVAAESEPVVDPEEYTQQTEVSEMSIHDEDLVDVFEVPSSRALDQAEASTVAEPGPMPTAAATEQPGEEPEEATSDTQMDDQASQSQLPGVGQPSVLRPVPTPQPVAPGRQSAGMQMVLLGIIGVGTLVASYLIFKELMVQPGSPDERAIHRTVMKSQDRSGDGLELPGPQRKAAKSSMLVVSGKKTADGGVADTGLATSLDGGAAAAATDRGLVAVKLDSSEQAALDSLAREAMARLSDGGVQAATATGPSLDLDPSSPSLPSDDAVEPVREGQPSRVIELDEKPVPVSEPVEKAAPAKQKPVGRPTCRRGMVLVPGGPFMAGSNVAGPVRSRGERRPTRVAVGDFCMDYYEFPNSRNNAPRGNFGAYQGKAMCEARGKRICQEDEWEKACQGPRGLSYGYGPGYIPERCNTVDENRGEAVPPSKYSSCRSGYKTFAMIGNLAEWVQSGSGFVLKGGSFEQGKSAARCAARIPLGPGQRRRDYGVRCCADPSYE